MALFDEQIQRIREKLPLALKADKDLMAFGADDHEYILNDPLTAKEVATFEKKYNIQLPDCYKTFILQIGNGGISYANAGAGPFYGIYPFGEDVNKFTSYDTEKYLKNDCVIYPQMSDEYWKSLNEKIDNDVDEEYGKIFGGILPIGTQGCSYFHGIIINGAYRGRVVNICGDRQKPQFTFEKNFLDWYERWLDEVISGELLQDGASWFGYSMGGPDSALISLFIETSSMQQKTDCLDGILNKQKIEVTTIQIVEEQFLNGSDEFKIILLRILTKFDYKRAKPYLVELAQTDIGTVCKFIRWYAKGESAEWVPLISENMRSVNDAEQFRFCAYLLVDAKADFGNLIVPFTKKEDEDIRVTAFYTLGQLKNKSDFLETFINGLNDSSNQVIHVTLQALDNVYSKKLLEHYKRIAEKFPEEEGYILSNLNYRLSVYGLTNKTILTKNDFGN